MFLPNKKDAIHKAWLYRTLTAIAEDNFLVAVLYFKGGTYAAMRNWLDRFSIDLDFDFMGRKNQVDKTKRHLENIFAELGLKIKDSSKNGIQYFLQYPTNEQNQRNTLKIDTFFPPIKKCNYETVRLVEIDKILMGQTRKTMFANKLIALKARFDENKNIAGRDLYDIHYFFLQGYDFDEKIIQQYAKQQSKKQSQQKPKKRSQKDAKNPLKKSRQDFLEELVRFIQKEITQKTIDQDINFLLSPKKFQQIRKTIKPETIMFLKDRISSAVPKS